MSREDGPPPAPRSGETHPARPTTPSLVLLEQLVALADRAIDAARAGDMAAVNALLDEREAFLTQLAAMLRQDPQPHPPPPPPAPAGGGDDAQPDSVGAASAPPALQLAELAQRDHDAMLLLERGIAKARIQVAGKLDEVASAQATVAQYAEDAPHPAPSPLAHPPTTIDIRR